MAFSATPQDIEAYLTQVAASGVLGKSKRRLKLLEYLLDAESSGAGGALKAYSIGIDVLDRPSDFDPAIDSSVRVEMGRMRTALSAFENSDAATAPIAVEIPVGSYRPVITPRVVPDQVTAGDTAPPVLRKPRRRMVALVTALVCFAGFGLFLAWPYWRDPPPEAEDYGVLVAIAPFDGEAAFASQIAASLRNSLLTNSVIAITTEPDQRGNRVDFELRGLVSPSGPYNYSHRINVELLSARLDRVIWTKSLVVSPLEDIQERVASDVGNELRVKMLGESRAFLEGRDPVRLTPQQLFIMATWVPGPEVNAVEWEIERIALMELALAKDPNHGAAHSVLADKLGYLANVDAASDTQDARDRAEMHSARALELAPLNPDVMFNVAQAHWHAGRIGESHAAMRRVLDLDPGHNMARFLSLVIPYTCAVPPTDVIVNAVAFDAALSPDNPIRWLTLSWIAWLHLNAGDDTAALEAEERAALIFEIPYTFMRHAMLLNKLGRKDEAAQIIERQRVNWPDISVDHFANATLPRLCAESPNAQPFLDNYADLLDALSTEL